MNRRFYFTAIFFSALTFLTSVISSLLSLLLHGRIFIIPGFLQWLVISGSIALIASMLQLKYYWHKKYGVISLGCVLYTAALLWHYVVSITMLVSQSVSATFNISYVTLLITWVLYGLTSLFSNARKRRWLLAA